VVLCVLLGLVALRWVVRDKASPDAAIAELQAIRHQWWALPAYVGLYFTLTTAFFPGLLFHLAAGATWGFPFAAVTNVVVMNTAATLQFWMARKLGRQRVAALLRRYGLLKLDSGAKRHGIRAMIAIRALPLPSMLVNASAGVSGITYRDFAVGTALGALPYILIYTWFAAAIAQGAAGAQRRAVVQGVTAGGAVLLLLLLSKLWSRRARKAAGLGGPEGAEAPPGGD